MDWEDAVLEVMSAVSEREAVRAISPYMEWSKEELVHLLFGMSQVIHRQAQWLTIAKTIHGDILMEN